MTKRQIVIDKATQKVKIEKHKPNKKLWYSRLVSSSCSTSDTLRITLARIEYMLINYDRGK